MSILQRRLVRVAAAAVAVAVVGWGAVIVAPTGASAAIVTTPTDLSIGDQYRLAFVTITTRDATSTDIADYNAFVTTAANTQADLVALGATWKAIGTTPTVDARDNTDTNPSSTGVPIYLLDGISRIADNNDDLWNPFGGNIDHLFNIFVDGTEAVAQLVWTGTKADGTRDTGSPFSLGEDTRDKAFAYFGVTSEVDASWVFHNVFDSSRADFIHLYAISSQLTVAAVPLPGALILFGSGLACLAVLRRRNRSVRPA